MSRSALVVSTLLSLGTSEFVTPEEKIQEHLKIAQSAASIASFNTSTTTKGSLAYIDNGSGCSGAVKSGFGFTLGECVVRDNEGSGVIYSNCYTSGGKVQFTFTECEDTQCKTGCKSTSMSEPSCDSDPVEPYNGMVKCETNEDAYHNYDALTLHTTRFYHESDTSCTQKWGYWSSIAMSCTSSYNQNCVSGGKYYKYSKVCEM